MVAPGLTIAAGATALLSGAALTVALVLPTPAPANRVWFDQPAALSMIAPGEHEILVHTNVQGVLLQIRVDVYDYDTGQVVEVLGSDGDLLDRSDAWGPRTSILSSDSVMWPDAQPGGYVLVPSVLVAGEFTTGDHWVESPETAVAVNVVAPGLPFSPIDPIPLPDPDPEPEPDPDPAVEPPPTGSFYVVDPFDPRARYIDVVGVTPDYAAVLVEVQVQREGAPTDPSAWTDLPCDLVPDGGGEFRCTTEHFVPPPDDCGLTYVGHARVSITSDVGVRELPEQTWTWSSRACDA
jgi:hypothetical protein